VLPKKQKTLLLVLALLSMVIDLSVIIPFRTLDNKLSQPEILFKFIAAPVLVILLSLYAIVLKYRKASGAKGTSRMVAVCSYTPVITYLVDVSVFAIYLLTRDMAGLGVNEYSLILGCTVAFTTVLLVTSYNLPKVSSTFSFQKHLLCDIVLLILTVGVTFGVYILNRRYQAVELKPDLMLLALYAFVLGSLFVKINFYKGVHKEDAVYVVVKPNLPAPAEGEADAEKATEGNTEYSQVITLTDNAEHRMQKKQKGLLMFFSLFGFFLCFLAVIPYKALLGWYDFELYFKFIGLPLMLLATVLYAFILKYRDAGKNGFSQALAVNCYFPIFVYAISICLYGLYLLLVGGTANLGLNAWGGLIAFYVIVLLVSIFLAVFFPRVQITLKKSEHLIADVALVIIFICINAFTGILFTTFKYAAASADVNTFILLVIFVLYITFAIDYIVRTNKKEHLYIEVPLTKQLGLVEDTPKPVEKKEVVIERVVEKIVEVKRDLTPEELQAIHDEEYKRAFADVLKTLQTEGVKSPVAAVANPLSAPLASVEKPKEKEPMVVEKHHAAFQENPAFVKTEKAEDEEVEETDKDYDKGEKPERIIEPSFLDIIKYTGSMPDVSYVTNENQNNYKFNYDNKMFLLAVNTNSGYNIFFLAEVDEIMNMIVKYPNITKAKTPKGENWFRLTNKGDFPEDVLYDIIEHSLEMLHVIEERKLEEKERIKELKQEAKEAERLRHKQTQQALKEKEKAKAKKAAKTPAKKTTTAKKKTEEKNVDEDK
jgi:hypothetical protein